MRSSEIATPLCPNCGSPVTVPHQICEACSPFKCQSCGSGTSFAYSKPKDINELKIDANKLFGYGATTGDCVECGNFKILNDVQTCHLCCTKQVKKDKLVCFNCLQPDNNWIYESKGICSNCFKYKNLNAAGACKECYSNLLGKEKTCIKCQRPFIAYKDEKLCDRCETICVGCSRTFQAKNKVESFCPVCTDKLSRGECLSCGNSKNVVLDNHGLCEVCSKIPYIKNIEKFYCKLCTIVEVGSPEEICNTCKTKSHLCPRCLEYEVHLANFVCEKCQKES